MLAKHAFTDAPATTTTTNNRALRLPLHRFSLICTDDLRDAQEKLAGRFGARAFNVCGKAQNPYIVKNHLCLKNLDLAYGSFAAPVEATFPEVDLVKQHICYGGAGQTSFGRSLFTVNQSRTVVIPAGVEIKHKFDSAFSQIMLRIRTGALQEKLGALIGTPVVRPIEFAPAGSFEKPEMARLRRFVNYFIAELDSESPMMPDQALAEFEQLLIVSFLAANRHNFTPFLEREQPRQAPWQVRMVEEYIEENWNTTLDIEALTAVTGGSARSIFTAFRAARGISPMAFAKSVRLRHARDLLQRPDASTAVIGVSFQCGFHNAGHFARDYRSAFGELPSATLMNAKRTRRARN